MNERKDTEEIFEMTMGEIFPDMMRDTEPQIEEPQ